MDTSDIQTLIQEQFRTLNKMIYANHAAISPWPRVTQNAVSRFAEENCNLGSTHYAQWILRETRLRDRIAGMLNAGSGDDIALLKNTTEGICTVSNGIEWYRGDNVVLPEGEFPSNQITWDMLEKRGVEVRRVPIQGNHEPEARLMDAIDHQTRVLSVSSVQWDTGLRLNLEMLGEHIGNTDTLFFVDAIQEFGALRLDVQRCHIDALSAGSHKWQMGPEGMGVFYCSEMARSKIGLSQHGWHMFDQPYRFDQSGRSPSKSARRFETGSPNSMGQVALYASLGLLCDVGLDEVESRILSNTASVTRSLLRMDGVELISSPERSRQSGIVSFVPEGMNIHEQRKALAKSGVMVAVRGSALRISPHFYQSGEPVEQLVRILQDQLNP